MRKAECKKCKGKGYIVKRYNDTFPERSKRETCSSCNGKGIITEEV